MFDADAYIAAMSPPSIVIEGETYTGKLLSFDEWITLMPTFEKLEEDGVPAAEFPAVARKICEAFDLPADKILKLPIVALKAALVSFFDSQTSVPTLPEETPEPQEAA